jgi:C4-type Zn-finger protein
MQKNARQNVEGVLNTLQNSKNDLNQAINTVEKAENKQRIQQTLNAVDNALRSAQDTLSNYKEQ